MVIQRYEPHPQSHLIVPIFLFLKFGMYLKLTQMQDFCMTVVCLTGTKTGSTKIYV